MPFLLTLLGGYLVLLVLLLLAENSIVFVPARTLYESPANHGREYEDVTVESEDGVKLHAWWVPARDSKLSILFCHGNAGNVADRAENACRLAAMGYDVLLFDYRGYGKSQGSPDERGVNRDAMAMLRHLRQRPGVDPAKVAYFGRSLGAAVAIELAVREPPAALIVESAFCSIRDMAWSIFPYALFAPFVPRHFDNLSKIPLIDCPKLVIHGNRDEIIPFDHGRRLYEAAREPRQFHDKGGSHNNIYGTDEPRYFEVIGAFLDGAAAASQPLRETEQPASTEEAR